MIDILRSVESLAFIGGVKKPQSEQLSISIFPALLNTQQYKVRIKGKVEQSRERSSTLPYTLV